MLNHLLYGYGYPGEECAEPVQLDEHLPHERAHRGGAAAARARVHLFLVVQVLGVPVEQVCRGLCVPDVHETCKFIGDNLIIIEHI